VYFIYDLKMRDLIPVIIQEK